MCGDSLPGFLRFGAEVGDDGRDGGNELVAGGCEAEFG